MTYSGGLCPEPNSIQDKEIAYWWSWEKQALPHLLDTWRRAVFLSGFVERISNCNAAPAIPKACSIAVDTMACAACLVSSGLLCSKSLHDNFCGYLMPSRAPFQLSKESCNFRQTWSLPRYVWYADNNCEETLHPVSQPLWLRNSCENVFQDWAGSVLLMTLFTDDRPCCHQ